MSGPTRLFALAAVAVILVGATVAGATELSGALRGTTALPAPRFVDDTVTSGIAHTYTALNDIGIGGGVAAFDCSGDRKPDLFVAGGGNPATILRNDSPLGGSLRFTALPDPVVNVTGVSGAYPIDIDGDGLLDLAVLRVGGVELLRGLGDCRFERANDRWSFDGGGGWPTAFSAKWEGDASLPTMAVGRYLRLDAMGPASYACDDNSLLRPDATGSRYAPPVALSPGYCTLSMLFSDWDRSGRRDLRVSNDRHYYDDLTGQEQLWRVAPGEPPTAYTSAQGWQAVQIWGMGIASQDLTGDGYPEVFLTSQASNRLQTLASGPAMPTFVDIGLKRGVNATHPYAGDTSFPSTAWHPQFEDVNNDGFVDLYVAKGNVAADPAFAIRDPSDLLIGQPDGTFTEGAAAAGLTEFDPGRGAAVVDLNLDGLPDLVEVKLGAPVRVWRNVGAGSGDHAASLGHWLAVRPTEAGPNRDAIGAWVEVRMGATIQRRELTIGGGHVSGQLSWIQFGLGRATSAEVRVTWPDGEVGPWLTTGADGFVIADRATGRLQPWSPTE